jgi:hypothetical protein
LTYRSGEDLLIQFNPAKLATAGISRCCPKGLSMDDRHGSKHELRRGASPSFRALMTVVVIGRPIT